jgi:hypothetical protein
MKNDKDHYSGPLDAGANRRVFLTARWTHLINLTYSVEPEQLKPHLPAGLELDLWEGAAHVSLVAFDFLNTRVLGIPVPFHINFPEVNLRFYVRWQGKPAVVFIREFVPRHAIAWSARLLYNEPYRAVPMKSAVDLSNGLTVRHDFHGQSIVAQASNEPYYPDEDSSDHHFKEHDLGFGIDHRGRTLAYRVEHPVWRIFPLKKVDLSVDFGRLYGTRWSFLENASPAYSLLAEGSDIKVRFPFRL